MNKKQRAAAIAIFLIVCTPVTVRLARAADTITAEGISDYTYFCNSYGCSGMSGNIYGAEEASGFYGGMTNPTGSPWYPGVFYTDSDVWDTDFYDPQISNDPADNDTSAFDIDYGPSVFSWITAHGLCDDVTTTACTSNGNCPSGQYCPSNPPSNYSYRRCVSNTARRIITSSSSSSHLNSVLYTGNNGVKWGEDSNSGSWAGAGTNGGTGVVILANSCGARSSFFWDQSKSVFGGMMQLNILMPVANVGNSGQPAKISDAAAWADRGGDMAYYLYNYPNTSIRDSWAAVEDDAPTNGNSSCPDQTNTMTYNGGHAFYGCGAAGTVAWAQTQALANSNGGTLTPNQARNFSNKPTGNTYGYAWFHCNYDCVTYPW